jgi:hypothetical protein
MTARATILMLGLLLAGVLAGAGQAIVNPVAIH